MKHLFLLTIAVILFIAGVVCIDLGFIFPQSIYLYVGFLVMSFTMAYLFIARMKAHNENNHEEDELLSKNMTTFLFLIALIIIGISCVLKIMLELHLL